MQESRVVALEWTESWRISITCIPNTFFITNKYGIPILPNPAAPWSGTEMPDSARGRARANIEGRHRLDRLDVSIGVGVAGIVELKLLSLKVVLNY